ncbi:BadF/BadG/BcrA/BcrD ATPase family protein [Asticcacaulis sp. EMRT-3]|uniref:BadF/BadG/BcrA/BcrD ATPase family protein n=1 Tax=Asticcacaulis sp. EMRT-3 TaxID=3040349 RepID=UPI0024AFFEA6|nr:BadF/BadG/BcrA/BcrD ATPase family protein [Asticcacaulis sp. EMRT-3]MDI7775173.1 BadF/BadG/BcrA/BcrD ATPase family protein [Asticcacaulis sp. EMRT-3]
MNTSETHPRFFAGVDGGGTKCRVRVRDAAGQLLGEAEGGPANIRLGLNMVWANILTALEKALHQAGEPAPRWEDVAIGLGLAGIADAADVARTLTSGPRFARCQAASDAHTACLGAFSGRDGAILISGTGSAGYGWVSGQAHPVGGWGFEVCDYGSAADLGREAIRMTLQAYDGLAPSSVFTTALLSHFGGHPAGIVHWVTTASPRDYGALAPMIMSHANQNDSVAVALVEKQAQHIGRYIARLVELGAAKVCLVGGMAPVFTPWLSPAARSALAEPEHDALDGAILLARGASNGLEDDVPHQSGPKRTGT